RRIGVAQIVDGVDDATMEEVAPDAIRQAPGEEWVLRGGQPLGVGNAAILSGRNLWLASAEETWRLGGAGPRVDRIAGCEVQHDNLRSRVAGRQKRIRLARYLVEEAGQAIVIRLRPVLERMVVALGTEHTDAAENLGNA